MSGIIIDVEGYQEPAETPLESKEVESSLLQKMKRAYADFFETVYEARLPKNQEKKPIYPQFKVIIIDEELYEEEVYEIVFDYDFFEQLCNMYIIEGWSGVLEIEKKIEEIIKNDKEAKQLSGGVKDIWQNDVYPKEINSWNQAKIFFIFTQKMLALLIRETLANIESFSAEQIIAKLSVTNIEIAKAWDTYKIQAPKTKKK